MIKDDECINRYHCLRSCIGIYCNAKKREKSKQSLFANEPLQPDNSIEINRI
jgi:hypothetical protein